MKTQFNKGFTLIELLVVISMVGLLSSIILASLNVSRANARDSTRLQTVSEMRKALELYRADNGKYPKPSITIGTINSFNDSNNVNNGAGSGVINPEVNMLANCRDSNYNYTFDQIFPGLSPRYISNSAIKSEMCYAYASDGEDYHLTMTNSERICTDPDNPSSSLCDFTNFIDSTSIPPLNPIGIYTTNARNWSHDDSNSDSSTALASSTSTPASSTSTPASSTSTPTLPRVPLQGGFITPTI